MSQAPQDLSVRLRRSRVRRFLWWRQSTAAFRGPDGRLPTGRCFARREMARLDPIPQAETSLR